jgi:hypothetical protein
MKKQVTTRSVTRKAAVSEHPSTKASNVSAPDAVPLTRLQAARLSALTGVAVSELKEGSIAKIAEKLKWRIDPELLFFRRICGQVVKTDPATGIDYPVPFATVNVEDTDCNFLGFFPIESPWLWLFPIFCHREVIATTKTDACGRFCVWVPRFEIDWILRWRLERYCYWDIFRKPNIQDILDHLKLPPLVEQPFPPRPGPDPGPLASRESVLQQLEPLLGRDRVRQLRNASAAAQFGGQSAPVQQLLSQPAFTTPVPPPVSEKFHVSRMKAGHETLANDLGVSGEVSRQIANFSPQRFIGPFLRCRTVIVPEWTPILDVPDITFRVSQDVDGNGTEETIYSESYFDVRWNAGAIPDVKLHASPIAVAAPVPADSPMCQQVEVPCETPAIVLAGLYPLHNLGGGAPPYLDAATGFAQRPNRPHPHATDPDVLPPGTLATAPFCDVLQLYGCNQRAGATYYRVLYAYTPPGGPTSAVVPFLNLTWPLWRWVGSPGHLEILNVSPDTQGWYEIIPDSDQWLPSHLILNWPTGSPGLYQVQMEFANAAKTVIGGSQTPPIGIYVDNTGATAAITEIRWRVQGEVGWNNHPPLSRVCAIVPRPNGAILEFRVTYQGSALHLRNLALGASGCGTGDPAPLAAPDWSDPPTPAVNGSGVSLSPYVHWHTGQFDNNVSRAAIFSLAAGALQGAYDVSLTVNSRAFNPAGGDGGFGSADWFYDVVYKYAYDYWKFAIIDV